MTHERECIIPFYRSCRQKLLSFNSIFLFRVTLYGIVVEAVLFWPRVISQGCPAGHGATCYT